jgi:hypothetical protein
LREKPTLVRVYLRELKQTRKDKPAQVREALDIYISLWEKALEQGLVRPDEEVGEALKRVGESGGLYRASGD